MSTTVVTTASGAIGGVVDGDAIAFRGIPYAQPPFGERLWRLPEAPERWDGVLECSGYGPICPQPALATAMLTAEPETQGEDCLRLTVWTPTLDPAGLPVMVWIHGGAYLFGSGSAPGNRGDTFARDGVVFVSLNYRLGALGFLHAGALRPERSDASGNYGLADQVAALRWVRENIGSFGGDPENVTIFGCSAGGNYVQSLSACPQAKGLFRRGISESAGGTALWGLPPHVAAQVAEVFFDTLGLGPAGSVDVASLGPSQILDAQEAMLRALRAGRYDDRFGDVTIPFYPVSGTDHQPVSAMEAAEAGATSHVDLVVGTNRHEMSLFKVMEEAGGSADVRPRQWVAQPCEAQVRDVYAATEPEASGERIDWTVAGDRGFRIPNLRAAEGRARSGARTWMYEFAWESPAFGGRLGAAHGLECPFVFDDIGSGLGQFLVGPDGPHDLAKTMHETWISFARSGRPASAQLPEWPEFDLEDRRVAVFDAEPRIESDRDRERREAWDGLHIGHTFPAA